MTAELYRQLRERIGTQEEVAAMLDVDVRTIRRRETGEMGVTREAELAIRHLYDRRKSRPHA